MTPKRPTPRSAGMYSHGGKTQKAKGFKHIDPAAVGQVRDASPATAKRTDDSGRAKATRLTAQVGPVGPAKKTP